MSVSNPKNPISSVGTLLTLITPACPAEAPIYKRTIKDNRYQIWASMLARCRNKNNPDWKYYGGKGIYVCKKWIPKGSGFINFCLDMGIRPSLKHTIDRINNAKGYSPENCQWLLLKLNCKKRHYAKKIRPPKWRKKERYEFLDALGLRYCTQCKISKDRKKCFAGDGGYCCVCSRLNASFYYRKKHPFVYITRKDKLPLSFSTLLKYGGI